MSSKKSNPLAIVEEYKFSKDDSKNFMGLNKIPEQDGL